jgi:hypothetical protein
MPLWAVNSPEWTGNNFGVMEHVETLLSYDGPITFTFRDETGSLMLAHLCTEDDGYARYFVAPTTNRIVEELKSGARSIRAAIDQPMTWLIDLHEGEFARAWVVGIAAMPPNVLPAPEVMLYPSLQPLLRTRAIGQRIRVASIPADAIRTLVSGVEGAIAALVRYVTERSDAEYPYDLQATRFAFGSIDIAFEMQPTNEAAEQPPGGPIQPDVRAEVESLLSRGLAWVSNEGQRLHAASPEEERAILEAMRQLAPKRGGDATRIEISGRVAGRPRDKKTLTNAVRQRASRRIRDLQRDEPVPIVVTLLGRLGNVDIDRFTAIRRRAAGSVAWSRSEVVFPPRPPRRVPRCFRGAVSR